MLNDDDPSDFPSHIRLLLIIIVSSLAFFALLIFLVRWLSHRLEHHQQDLLHHPHQDHHPIVDNDTANDSPLPHPPLRATPATFTPAASAYTATNSGRSRRWSWRTNSKAKSSSDERTQLNVLETEPLDSTATEPPQEPKREWWNPVGGLVRRWQRKKMEAEEGEEGMVLQNLERVRKEEGEDVRFWNSFDWSSDEEVEYEVVEDDEGSELGLGKYFWENGVGIRDWED